MSEAEYLKEPWAYSRKTRAAELAPSFPNYVSYLGEFLQPPGPCPHLRTGCHIGREPRRTVELLHSPRWSGYCEQVARTDTAALDLVCFLETALFGAERHTETEGAVQSDQRCLLGARGPGAAPTSGQQEPQRPASRGAARVRLPSHSRSSVCFDRGSVTGPPFLLSSCLG